MRNITQAGLQRKKSHSVGGATKTWWDTIQLRVRKATDLSDASSWNMSPEALMTRKRKRGGAFEFQVGDEAEVGRGCLKGLTVRICEVDACPALSKGGPAAASTISCTLPPFPTD